MSNLGNIIDPTQTFPDATGGAVPSRIAARKRFPVLFLVDVSGSTGDDPENPHIPSGPNADIHRLNRVITQTLQTLRTPTPGTDLANQQSSLDICLMTYSDSYKVIIPWTVASNLNPNIAPFTTEGSTHTAKALNYPLGYMKHRLRYYRSQNLKSGRPIILHFTDGAPTDMKPGEPAWEAVKTQLKNLTPDVETRHVDVRHLITANGADPKRSNVLLPDGTSTTGLNMLALLSGDKAGLPLTAVSTSRRGASYRTP
jgi:uncharacterized protein YegL